MIRNKFIEDEMYKLKISKAEMARRIKMKSDMTLIRRLRGDSDWKVIELVRISKELKCSITNLIDWDDSNV